MQTLTDAIIFVAFDGTKFFTEAECRKHEDANEIHRFVGLSAEDVLAAQNGSNADLALAFETFGGKLARKRRETGNLRRNSPTREQDGAKGGQIEPQGNILAAG